MSIERDLMELKDKIGKAKTRRDQAQGVLKQRMADLRSEFGVKTVKAAKKKVAELAVKAERLGAKLKEGITKLEEAMR